MLKSTFEALQAVLNDAERKKLMGKRNVTKWLYKLKIVAYEMEDILDEWRTEIQGSQLETTTHNLLPIEKLRAHFQTHIWICVSDPFDDEMVKKSIIREATINKPFDPQTWLALNTKPTDALTWHLLNKELVESIDERNF
ncbi:hypothetical protein MKW92_037599 [Papaver armeniacum]|nr:hypothetical protein MKW92_037599 [Papaver armeniacum]